MSDDTEESPPPTEETSLVRRIGQRVSPVVKTARSGLGFVRESRVGAWLERRANDLAEVLVRPETARRIQEVLVRLAQFGMERGFDADPDARLLFDFSEWLEERHGREAVLETVLRHNPILDGSLLRLAETVVRPGASAENVRSAVDDSQLALLRLLAHMVELQDEADVEINRSSPAALRAFIETSSIPDRFHELAAKAAGDPSAFRQSRDAEATSSSRRAIQIFAPTLEDPSVRFLLTSFVFFVQTYLTREMIERFPDMVESIAALPRETDDEAAPHDVIDIDD